MFSIFSSELFAISFAVIAANSAWYRKSAINSEADGSET